MTTDAPTPSPPLFCVDAEAQDQDHILVNGSGCDYPCLEKNEPPSIFRKVIFFSGKVLCMIIVMVTGTMLFGLSIPLIVIGVGFLSYIAFGLLTGGSISYSYNDGPTGRDSVHSFESELGYHETGMTLMGKPALFYCDKPLIEPSGHSE